MKLLNVVYSRLSSRRLPQKALSIINGNSLVSHMVYSLSELKQLGDVVIGTSTDPSDDLLVEHCDSSKLKYFRGDLNNVALRTEQIIDEYQPEFLCRICGDRALITPDFITHAINIFESYHSQYELITNLNSVLDPPGLKIEFINCKTFQAHSHKFNKDEREHITKYFYNDYCFDQSKIFHFDFNTEDRTDVNLCIDTINDLDLVNKVLTKLTGEKMEYNHENVYSIIKNV